MAWATRRGEFGLIATMGALRQVVGSAASVALGLLKFGVGGLIVGGFLSVSIANVRLGRPVFRDLRSLRSTRAELVDSARRQSEFPQQTLPAELLSATYLNGFPLVVGAMFGGATLEVVALSGRIVTLPASIVGNSVSQTYFRQASALRASPREARRLFDKIALTWRFSRPRLSSSSQ